MLFDKVQVPLCHYSYKSARTQKGKKLEPTAWKEEYKKFVDIF